MSLIMKRYCSIALLCFFASNLNAADIKVMEKDIHDINSKNAELVIKVKEGVLSMLSGADVQEVVSIIFIKGNPNGSALMDAWQKPWTDETIVLIADAFNQYLNSYGINVFQDKKDLLADHLQRFAAFKAAVFSSYPPCKELAQVISSQVAQGIRWVNREEYVYPSEKKRLQAKKQIIEFFDYLENYLISLSSSTQINELIQKEISILQESYMWKVDSPFFAHGKKVFIAEEFESIVNESGLLCKTYFSETDFNIPDTFLPSIKEKQTNSLVRRIVHLSKNPLLKAYGEGMGEFSTAGEIAEHKNLIEKIRLNLFRLGVNNN